MEEGDKPFQTAYEAYHEERPLVDWEEMLLTHLLCENAWVIKTPKLFVAARLVGEEWNDDQICSLLYSKPEGDMLHVYVCAGELGELMSEIPKHMSAEQFERLEWISFQRKGYIPHRWPLKRVRALPQNEP